MVLHRWHGKQTAGDDECGCNEQGYVVNLKLVCLKVMPMVLLASNHHMVKLTCLKVVPIVTLPLNVCLDLG